MDIKVSPQAPGTRHKIKKAPLIARGIFLSCNDVRQTADKMLKASGVREAELSIVFLGGKAMRGLNRKSLGHDYVTDVITFDLRQTLDTRHWTLDGKRQVRRCSSVKCQVSSVLDGEIYICCPEAQRNAKFYGEPVEREILRYVAHGILHLLGLDDGTEAERARMRKLEDKLLGCIGTGHKTQGTGRCQ